MTVLTSEEIEAVRHFVYCGVEEYPKGIEARAMIEAILHAPTSNEIDTATAAHDNLVGVRPGV